MRNYGLLLLTLNLLVSCVSCVLAEVRWERMSSVTGRIPIPNAGDQQTCCVVCDIDKDGKDDFVVGERTKTPSVVWYRFTGKKFERHVIDNTRLKPEAGGASCDIDKDGDVDIILGQDGSGNQIWWWENPYPNYEQPWKRRYIKKGGARKHHDQSCADYDGDGKAELASWNQGGKILLLYELPSYPKTDAVWQPSVIYTWKSGRELEGFPSIPVDVDLDGKVDIIGGGRWFKHKGNHKFEAQVIDDSLRFTQCAAGQLVKGSRPEIVFSPGDMKGDAKWFEYKNGKWVAHTLRYVNHGHTCEIRDVDGDGNLDIMIGEMGEPGAGDNAKVYIWYGDGKGQFKQNVALKGQGIHEGLFGDFDGDGDLDLLVKPYHHNSPRIDVLWNRGEKAKSR